MVILTVLSGVSLFLLIGTIAGGLYGARKMQKKASNAFEKITQESNKDREALNLKFSSLYETLSVLDKVHREDFVKLKHQLDEMQNASSLTYEKITAQIKALSEQQNSIAVSNAEAIKALSMEQREIQSKTEALFTEKTADLTELIEAIDSKSDSAFEKVYTAVDGLSTRQQSDAAAAIEKIQQLKEEQREIQSKTEALFTEKTADLTELIEAIDSKSDSAFEKVYTAVDGLSTRQQSDAAAAIEKIQQLKEEQREIQSKTEALFTDKTADLTELIEAIDSKSNSAFEKVYRKLNDNAEQQKEDKAEIGESFRQLKEDQNKCITNLEQNSAIKIAAIEKNLTQISNKSDLLADQCTTFSEYMTILKKESIDRFDLFLEKVNNDKSFYQEKFISFEASIKKLMTESETLRKEFTAITQAQTQIEVTHNKKTEEFKSLLELRLAGLLAALQLLETNLQKNNSSTQVKTEKAVVSSLPDNVSSNSLGKDKKKQNIYAPNGDEIRFTKQTDGKTISKTYRKGKLCFEILHSPWGVPEKGTMYAEDGKVLKYFEYDSNGQVKQK